MARKTNKQKAEEYKKKLQEEENDNPDMLPYLILDRLDSLNGKMSYLVGYQTAMLGAILVIVIYILFQVI